MMAVPKDLMPDNPTRRDLYVIDIGAMIIIDITLVLLNLLLYYFLKHMKIKKNDKLNSEELDNNIKHLTKIIILFLIFSLFLLIRFSNSSYAIMAVSEEYYGYKFAILNFLFILFVNIILEVIANRTYKINITQVIFNAIIESNIVILTIIQRIIFGYNFLFVIIGLIGFALLKFRVLSYKKKKYNLPIKLVLTSISCIIIFISTYTCSLISTDKSGEEKMFYESNIQLSNYCEEGREDSSTGFNGSVYFEIGKNGFDIESSFKIILELFIISGEIFLFKLIRKRHML